MKGIMIMKKYEQHEFGKLLPKMTPEEFDELKKDIKSNGLSFPIYIYENKILDGWHRYCACIELNITPKYETYTGDSPIQFVFSSTTRRNLSSTQKACLAVESLHIFEAEAKKRMSSKSFKSSSEKYIQLENSGSKGKATVEASNVFGVNPTYISKVKKIKNTDPEKYNRMKSGESDIQDIVREIKIEKHQKKVEIAKNYPVENQNEGPYSLILADPPWRYDFTETDSRRIENQYPTATVEEIISHRPDATKDSILFLWATAPKLQEALKVMEGWGFEYKSHAIWNKETIGMGYWWRGSHELLLVGTRGNVECTPESERVSSIYSEKKTKHSKKPECVYQWIEKAFPLHNKLEMYSRVPRSGWAVWGNEV